MPGLHSNVDPDGLLEYSVVFTDRSLNHMSQKFQGGDAETMPPRLKRCTTPDLRFLFREAAPTPWKRWRGSLPLAKTAWSFETGGSATAGPRSSMPAAFLLQSTVFKARRAEREQTGPVRACPRRRGRGGHHRKQKSDLVFAPHVETASGMILPDDYIRAVSDAVHAVGGMFVLDCVASGAIWVDMQACGVDVLISAPQKGWSSSPSSGLVMLNATGPREN